MIANLAVALNGSQPPRPVRPPVKTFWASKFDETVHDPVRVLAEFGIDDGLKHNRLVLVAKEAGLNS